MAARHPGEEQMPRRSTGRGGRATFSLVAVLVTVSALAPAPLLAATDRLPNLRMAAPTDFYFQVYNGQRRLRFTTYMLNLGQGPFVILGRRTAGQTVMTVRQRIFRSDGTAYGYPGDATMRYTGDGHDHWHIQRVAIYEVLQATRGGFRSVQRDGRALVGAKVGFCFFDTNPWDLSLPGAPGGRVYQQSGCGTRYSLSASMGLSVGWADKYPANFAYQWIDLAGVPGGRYRVCVTVDKQGYFRETSESDNAAWADVSFTSSSQAITVLGRGTGSCGPRV
jgi:hypothetical protein